MESSIREVTSKEEYNENLRRQDDNCKTKNDNDCINDDFTNNTLDAPNVFAPFNILGINNPDSSIISILIEVIHNIGISLLNMPLLQISFVVINLIIYCIIRLLPDYIVIRQYPY